LDGGGIDFVVFVVIIVGDGDERSVVAADGFHFPVAFVDNDSQHCCIVNEAAAWAALELAVASTLSMETRAWIYHRRAQSSVMLQIEDDDDDGDVSSLVLVCGCGGEK